MIKRLPYSENLVKIGATDPEIICFKRSLKNKIKKELNGSRTYSPRGRRAGTPRGLYYSVSK